MIYVYYGSLIILIPGILLSIYANFRINSTFKKYSKVSTQKGFKASDVAKMLLYNKNCNDVSVEKISGKLTDNFNPSNNILSLSDSTYNSDSVAAIGVAAHEVGHACQHNDGYFMMKLRSFLVPAVNIGSTLAFPLAILGVFLEWFSATMFGPILIVMGIILYSLSFVFSFITLPTELNASKRAKQMLYEYGFVTKQEQKQVGSVLYAAALTYFASLIVSFLYLLRFVVIIASLRRKD